MKIFEIISPFQKSTIQLNKVSDVIETIQYETVVYNGLHNIEQKSYTIILDSGTQVEVKPNMKIVDISWLKENPHYLPEPRFVKREKEIKFDDFYKWYQEQCAKDD